MISSNSVLLCIKCSSALLIAATGIALAGNEAELWTLSDRWKFSLSATPIFVGFLGATTSAAGQFFGQRLEKKKKHAEFVLAALAWDLHDITGIDVRDLGTAAYIKHRWGRWVWPWQEGLRRLARVRPKLAGTSGVRWRPGVGVVGQAVSKRRDVCENLDLLDSQLTNATKPDWEQQDEDARMGMSFDEYHGARGMFAVVLASPMIHPNSSEVVGCLSVDAPAGSYAQLSGDPVRAAVGAAADELAQRIFS
ncbi:hypothetical protein ACFWBR_25030 [Streptomyces sp. NPDC060006]|uniref:hypothetical protein n=1 Tax=unclassified Streptomyces TaxID=2593676 RepID=UPI00369C4CA3